MKSPRWTGLAIETFARLMASTKGRCPLCDKPFSRDPRRQPAVDHRHRDGLIRGIICVSCNERLGRDHENIAWYRRAAEYLTYPPALNAIGEHFIPGSIGEDMRRATEDE